MKKIEKLKGGAFSRLFNEIADAMNELIEKVEHDCHASPEDGCDCESHE